MEIAAEQAEAQLRNVLPSHSPEGALGRVEQLLEQAVRAGITTVVDPQSYLENLPVYAQLKKQGRLPQRLQIALFHRRGTSDAVIDKFAQARQQYNDDKLRVGAAKLYIDDVIEPHTAAMLAPYADRPATRGALDYPVQEFNQVVAKLDQRGFQIFTHATGDRGIRTALDAYEYARKVNGPRDSRHEIVHVECLSEQDIPRFKALGVTACMQPRHCASGYHRTMGASNRTSAVEICLGLPELARFRGHAGLLKRLERRRNGARDRHLYRAHTPGAGRPTRAAGGFPSRPLTWKLPYGAIPGSGAYANFLEGNRGSLVAGKYADLVLLSGDLFAVELNKIKDVKAVWTVVGGREAYKGF